MERIIVRPHHAELLIYHVELLEYGLFDPDVFKKVYSKVGYPKEVAEEVIDIVYKLHLRSIELEIGPPNSRDLICNLCIKHSNGKINCSGYRKRGGQDYIVLKEKDYKVGQIIMP